MANKKTITAADMEMLNNEKYNRKPVVNLTERKRNNRTKSILKNITKQQNNNH